MQALYKNIMIKLSGEALMGGTSSSVDVNTVNYIIDEIKKIKTLGVNIGIVIGGGNFFRGISGAKDLGLERTNADSMGMLATVMNGILLKDSLLHHGLATKVYSQFIVGGITKPYNRDSMMKRLHDGDIIIFVGGTGNPLFTTDSAAALKSIEMNADILIKATKVDGIYDCDPIKNPQAIKYDTLTFDEAINKKLKVMDTSAFALCQENNMMINVCSIFKPNSLLDVVLGKKEGTFIKG